MIYILWHKNGGWWTATGMLHSDWKKAAVLNEAEAADLVAVHEGKLIPCQRDFYTSNFKSGK